MHCLMEPDELGLVHHCSWGLFYKEGVFSFGGPSKSLQISKWLFCCWFGSPPPKKKSRNTFMGFGFSASCAEGDQATPERVQQNPTKPSTCRAEEEDKNRSFFCFFFLVCFCLYCMVGVGVGEVS